MKKATCFIMLFLFQACSKPDPLSPKPVLQQLEGTTWRSQDLDVYTLEIRRGGKVRVRLGGVLGLAETSYIVKQQDTNFMLVSLYEDTPNPFLMAVSIVDGSTIRVGIWVYKTDLRLQEAKDILENTGRIFKKT
ncbi:MAG: hypothetical protein ACRCY4_08300 [Brevinema sp.]